MIQNFQSIEDINLYYAERLHELASVSKNVNNEVLQLMLDELIKDYKVNVKLLTMKEKFTMLVYKKQKKMEMAHERLDVDFELKKRKHLLWRKYWNNFRLFKVFKKQTKAMADNEVKQAEVDLEELKNKYFNKLELENKNPACARLEPAHKDSEGCRSENLTALEEHDSPVHGSNE